MNHMRKLFALAMVALLAMTFALTVAGCGQKAQETPAATETPAMDNSMNSSEGTMSSDSAMADTSMAH